MACLNPDLFVQFFRAGNSSIEDLFVIDNLEGPAPHRVELDVPTENGQTAVCVKSVRLSVAS